MHRVAVILVALAFVGSVAVAHASWPTTCVQLNDLAEAAAGNANNVGIYQRVWGSQAEAACRHDHWDDVRGVFWWAVQGTQPPPPQAPPPATTLFHVDPGLQVAWDLTHAHDNLDWSSKSLHIRFGVLPPNTLGVLRPSTTGYPLYTILINDNLRYERPEALAALLDHEMTHLAFYALKRPETFENCLRAEVWAVAIEGSMWATLAGNRAPTTALERHLQSSWDAIYNDGQSGARIALDLPLYEWPATVALLYARGYDAVCAA